VGASDTVSGKEIWADTGTFRFRETRTVEAIENVTTPAGTFKDCVRVRFDHVYLDKPPGSFFSVSRYWFAKNVGIVKYELTSQKAQGELEKAKIASISYPQ